MGKTVSSSRWTRQRLLQNLIDTQQSSWKEDVWTEDMSASAKYSHLRSDMQLAKDFGFSKEARRGFYHAAQEGHNVRAFRMYLIDAVNAGDFDKIEEAYTNYFSTTTTEDQLPKRRSANEFLSSIRRANENPLFEFSDQDAISGFIELAYR